MNTREQINQSAAAFGYRLPTAEETAAAASVTRERAAMMADLTRGKITPDEYRALNRALRARHDENTMTIAGVGAVAKHVQTFG